MRLQQQCNVSVLFVVTLITIAFSHCRAAAQEKIPDSTVVFMFKTQKEQFWADYKDNRKELDRLANFLHINRDKIIRGIMPIFVDGYATSMITMDQNLALAKLRSNHVKSYMVMMYGFKESFFKTQNHADSIFGMTEIVTVSFIVPKTEAEPDHVVVETVKETNNHQPKQVAYEKDSVSKPKLIPQAINAYPNPTTPADGLVFEDANSYALLEKHSYFVSLFANFHNMSVQNILVEPLFDVHKIYNLNVDLSAAFGYFVSNNVAMGLYGGYKFSDLRVDVSSDILQLLFNSKRYETNNVSSGFNLGVFNKIFIPLEYSHRIFLINETSIFYTQTQSLQRNVYDRGVMLSKVYQNTYAGGVKLSVGFMYFLCNGLTMEFNISPVAAMYQWNEVVNNETLHGKFAGGAINTFLLPIDLKFGLSYLFGLDYKKNKRYINYIHNTLLK